MILYIVSLLKTEFVLYIWRRIFSRAKIWATKSEPPPPSLQPLYVSGLLRCSLYQRNVGVIIFLKISNI